MDSRSSPLQVSSVGNRHPQLPCSRTVFSHCSFSCRYSAFINLHPHWRQYCPQTPRRTRTVLQEASRAFCLYAKSCAGGFSHLQLPDFWNLQDLVVWRNPDITVETRQTKWILCSKVEIRFVMFLPVYVCMYFFFFWIARVHVHALVCAFLSPPPPPTPVLMLFQIACVFESIESASRSTTDCSTTKSDYETYVSALSAKCHHEWCSINHQWHGWRVVVCSSDPSRHRGGERRLRPGDLQTLHRQIARGKSSIFALCRSTSLSPVLLLPHHHRFMMLTSSHVSFTRLSVEVFNTNALAVC